MSEREFWLAQRDALLCQVDAIERLLSICPRTAELRHEARRERIELLKQTEREANCGQVGEGK